MMQRFDIYRQHIFLVATMFILGFSSGLPLLLVSSTLQTWFTDSGIDLVTVGSLSLIGLPYLLKWLWSPILDLCHITASAGRRFWIVCTQFCLMCTLMATSMCTPQKNMYGLMILSSLTAFLSATQDAAIDAYRQVVTPEYLRPMIIAWSTLGYRLAMVVSGGLALGAAEYFSWHWVYAAMSMLMFLNFILVLFMVQPCRVEYKHCRNVKEQCLAPIECILHTPSWKWCLVFILLYKLSDAFLITLLQPFLIHGMGYKLGYVGWLVKVFGLIATIIGTLVAGVLWPRLEKKWLILGFGVLQSAAVLLFVYISLTHHDNLTILAIFMESFANGATTCFLLAVIMALCDIRFAATHMAVFTAASSIPRVVIGPLAGFISEHYGWTNFFTIAWVLSIPGLVWVAYAASNKFSGM